MKFIGNKFPRAWAPRASIALYALLAGCVSVPPTGNPWGAPAQLASLSPAIGPQHPPASVDNASQAPSAVADAPDDDASADPPLPPGTEKACPRLASDIGSPEDSAPAQPEDSSQAETSAAIPDPDSGDAGKSPSTVVAAAGSTGDFAARVVARSAQLSRATAGDDRAEKAAEAGQTARAAELYAADWKASPKNWNAAAKAVELWARIGDYLSAEILLKGAMQHPDLADEARELDKKLNVAAGATDEANRLWKRTFALEPEGRYAEAVALLRRLQDFDPTAPGFYIREASFFARCNDAARAADAIARGSAAGVSFAGQWAPAQDPSLVRLWPDPKFQAAIRDTLGEAAVEDFEEHLTEQ